MYKYETHLHTAPVSRCACVGVEETVKFYKDAGYHGVFITNHFIGGNINLDHRDDYTKALDFYFSDYDNGVKIGKALGIKVFLGVEVTYGGTDFLVYGLEKQWYYKHPEIMKMNMRDMLEFMMGNGALVVQAHPFREAGYIDHIRLFPRSIQGVEIINACRTDFENEMAKLYAQKYGLLQLAGSDNHIGGGIKILAGMCSDEPINDEKDFIDYVKSGKMKIFSMPNE
ncbi:MAG: hypothetical protein E7542_06160 [Ruminococcaceae bacterium]|nr:hypothetical protein [Oscillospiraceae bacterium]